MKIDNSVQGGGGESPTDNSVYMQPQLILPGQDEGSGTLNGLLTTFKEI